MAYRVTYAIDSLDPNPDQWTFDSEHEALDFLSDEIERRIAFQIEHSPYTLDESEYEALREVETSLARIEHVEESSDD
jgi:hypothetical protein